MITQPYEAPLAEVEEYFVEIGVDGSFATNNQEVTEYTEFDGDNDPGGEFDDGNTDWFDF